VKKSLTQSGFHTYPDTVGERLCRTRIEHNFRVLLAMNRRFANGIELTLSIYFRCPLQKFDSLGRSRSFEYIVLHKLAHEHVSACVEFLSGVLHIVLCPPQFVSFWTQ